MKGAEKMTQTSDLNTKKLGIKRHAIRIITSGFIYCSIEQTCAKLLHFQNTHQVSILKLQTFLTLLPSPDLEGSVVGLKISYLTSTGCVLLNFGNATGCKSIHFLRIEIIEGSQPAYDWKYTCSHMIVYDRFVAYAKESFDPSYQQIIKHTTSIAKKTWERVGYATVYHKVPPEYSPKKHSKAIEGMAPPLKGSPGRLPVWRHDLRIRHRKHPDVFATKRDVVKFYVEQPERPERS